jgi:hypothetical protein
MKDKWEVKRTGRKAFRMQYKSATCEWKGEKEDLSGRITNCIAVQFQDNWEDPLKEFQTLPE